MNLKCHDCMAEGDYDHKPIVYSSIDKESWLCYRHWLRDIHKHGLKLENGEVKSKDNDGRIS